MCQHYSILLLLLITLEFSVFVMFSWKVFIGEISNENRKIWLSISHDEVSRLLPEAVLRPPNSIQISKVTLEVKLILKNK